MILFKRIFSVSTAIGMLLLFLICLPSLPAKAEKRNLRISAGAWMFQKYPLDEAEKNFIKHHPDVEITWTKTEMNEVTPYMLQWSRGKTTADILMNAEISDLAPLVAKDLVIDFEDIFTGEFAKDKWMAGFLNACTINGKVYALPFDSAVFTLIVRKDWLEEAGLVDSSGKIAAPKDLDELYDYVRKLTEKDSEGKTTRFGLEARWHTTTIYTYLSGIKAMRGSIYEPDGKTIDFSSQEALKCLDFWYRGVTDGYISAASVVDHNAPRNHFKAGITGMLWVDHGRFIECGQIIGFDKMAAFPIPGSEKHGTSGYIMAFVVPKVSPNQDLAKQFIKEELHASSFVQWTWDNYGKLMSYIPAYEGTEVMPELLAAVIAQGQKISLAPLYKGHLQLREVIRSEIGEMLTLKQTPEQTLENMRRELEKIDLSLPEEW